ncbi:hypothetical protein GPECTOR_11g152 [Gonium pectorale]|uniref:RRM domain-containing protein n=1 Tax=Gonium pectorale TaxID=33097 RepID=A0A150GPE1_GONPE|nr:hypothetical protein GPECTOR_11g152 [Gonium pectorale]|eukprot:KXZ51703.1 hypothetical protein GPECTOR_11g152 [Gonium pectorale]
MASQTVALNVSEPLWNKFVSGHAESMVERRRESASTSCSRFSIRSRASGGPVKTIRICFTGCMSENDIYAWCTNFFKLFRIEIMVHAPSHSTIKAAFVLFESPDQAKFAVTETRKWFWATGLPFTCAMAHKNLVPTRQQLTEQHQPYDLPYELHVLYEAALLALLASITPQVADFLLSLIVGTPN